MVTWGLARECAKLPSPWAKGLHNLFEDLPATDLDIVENGLR